MARILLIDPPFSAFMGFSRWFFPMGPAVLANFLMGKGHEVLVYDADHIDSDVSFNYSQMLRAFEDYRSHVNDLSHQVYRQIADMVKDFAPDVVGISCMSVKVPAALASAETVKDNIDVPVVCGGPHATKLPEHLLKSPYVNYVIRESGLASFDLLVDQLAGSESMEPGKIPNLSYNSDGKNIVHNPVSHREWESMSWYPARGALKAPGQYGPHDMSMIMASIGCPFECQFCARTFDDQLVHRRVENICTEIEELVNNHGVDFLHFKDDTMGTNKSRLRDICEIIAANDAISGWECLTRIDVADDEALTLLKGSKCLRVKVGVESGSPAVLKQLNKRITPEDVIDFSSRAKKHDLPWSAFYMIGLPDETPDDILLTLNLIEKSRPNHVSMSIFTPYPGSHMYDQLMREGRMPAEIDWSALDPFSLAPQLERAIAHDEFVNIATEVMAFVDGYNQDSDWNDKA
ncbi:MAG: B12-binding domain-containing radical SAM protein [Candidatus Zixiibacteriota bacterium]|nr:MAG: B12-binding domain-containing radical SAM protein [candidate division Zixibacteria bacterium]